MTRADDTLKLLEQPDFAELAQLAWGAQVSWRLATRGGVVRNHVIAAFDDVFGDLSHSRVDVRRLKRCKRLGRSLRPGQLELAGHDCPWRENWRVVFDARVRYGSNGMSSAWQVFDWRLVVRR